MKTISLVQLKGGSGKTTLAANIADELHTRGHRVAIFDADQQASITSWSVVQSNNQIEGPVVFGAKADTLTSTVKKVGDSFDWCLLDTAPRINRGMRSAIIASDLVLVPVTPSQADLWALSDTLDLLKEAQVAKPELIVRVVLNRVFKSQALSKTVIEALHNECSFPMMAQSLGHRVAYAEALGTGQGVGRYERSSVAAWEVSELTDEIEALFEAEPMPLAVGGE